MKPYKVVWVTRAKSGVNTIIAKDEEDVLKQLPNSAAIREIMEMTFNDVHIKDLNAVSFMNLMNMWWSQND